MALILTFIIGNAILFAYQLDMMQSPPCDAVPVRSLVSVSLRSPCQFDIKRKTLMANTDVTPDKQTNKKAIKYLPGTTMGPTSEMVPVRSLVSFESLSVSLRSPCQFDTKRKTLVAN